MGLLKLLEGNESSIGLLLIVLAIIAIVVFFGLVSYFLLCIAFPEYLTFGWYWYRFLSLGIIEIVFFM